MPKELDLENMRFCIDNFPQNSIFIRLMGSHGGTVKVSEELNKKKKLDFKKDDSGLYFMINKKEIFHFPLEDYLKGFAIEYHRYDPKDGHMIIRSGLLQPDPYEKGLPEPRFSTLRNVLDYHLIEINFKGRIDLKFHSWWHEPHSKYWTIDKEKMLKNKQ